MEEGLSEYIESLEDDIELISRQFDLSCCDKVEIEVLENVINSLKKILYSK